MTMKQNNNKLSLTVRGVSSVVQAIDLFNSILSWHESTVSSERK
jgi:hypothetical protein